MDRVVPGKSVQADPDHRRNEVASPNNLPVREVSRTIIFTNTNSFAKSTAYGNRPNTHWCAGRHGADSSAKRALRRATCHTSFLI